MVDSGYRRRVYRLHRGLPSPSPRSTIITLDDPLTVARHPDPADRPGDYYLVGGLHHAGADLRTGWIWWRGELSPSAVPCSHCLPCGELVAGPDGEMMCWWSRCELDERCVWRGWCWFVIC